MISLETARKLKEAGLQWKPELGDLCNYDNDEEKEYSPGVVVHKHSPYVVEVKRDKDTSVVGHVMYFTWLPRLDQLLAEIEKRGYEWRLEYSEVDGLNDYHCLVSLKGENKFWGYGSESPKEAAAQALFWILEQEKEETNVNNWES